MPHLRLGFGGLALASWLIVACSSNESGTGAQGGAPASSGGANQSGAPATSGGATSSGGASVMSGGASVTSGGASVTSGGAASGGAAVQGGNTASGGASTGSGGAGMSGATGTSGGTTGMSGGTTGSGGSTSTAGGGAGGGGSSTKSYTCNLVIGIDSTDEWFGAGFENQVPNDKWEIIYHHPGYIEDWADPNDDVYKASVVPVTSPCAMNSDNPDRVIFNMFADGSDSNINTKTAWVTTLTKAITNLKAKYSRLKRIDLLTMTRTPNNMPCVSSNAAGSSVAQYVDDAVTMLVSAGPPAIVASNKFTADCSVFKDGGPHFTDTAKPMIAKLYGDYYSAEQ